MLFRSNLVGASLFTGNTTVEQGVLEMSNSTALGTNSGATPSTITVLDGAALQINGTTGSPLAIAQTLLLSGTGLAGLGLAGGTGALLNTGGNNKVTGSIYLQTLPNFDPSSAPSGQVAIGAVAGTTLTIANPVSENAGSVGGFNVPAGLIKVGAGTVVLQSADTFSGSTLVSAGILEIQDGGALGTRDTSSAGTPGSIQQIVTLDPGLTGNTFTISIPSLGLTTAPIAMGATPLAVQNAINALLTDPLAGYSANAGDPQELQVSVTQSSVATQVQPTAANPSGAGAANTGFVYTVTFTGMLAPTTTVVLAASGQHGVAAGASTVALAGIGTQVAAGAELDLHDLTTPVTTATTMTIAVGDANGGATIRNVSGVDDGVAPNVINGELDFLFPGTITTDAGSTLQLAPSTSGDAPATGGSDITKAGAGTLQVDGLFTNNFNLAAGTLSGTGFVGSITGGVGGGTVHPGDNLTQTIGVLTTGEQGVTGTGNVVLGNFNSVPSSNDHFFVNLGAPGTNPGTPADPSSLINPLGDTGDIGTSDQLYVTNGSVTLNQAILDGALLGSGHHIGNTFTIIRTDYGSGPNTQDDTISGTFAGTSAIPTYDGGGAYAATRATIGGTQFEVDYFIDHVNVTQIDDSTSTSLTSSGTPVAGQTATYSSVYGQPVTFTAQVSYTGTATPNGGFVSFMDGSTVLGVGQVGNGLNGTTLGVATYTTGPFDLTTIPTQHTITAVYQGYTDPNSGVTFPQSTSTPVYQQVQQATTTTSLTTSPFPNSSFGQTVTFTATVASNSPGAGVPTGTVDFYIDGLAPANDVSGPIAANSANKYVFAYGSMAVGQHTIYAVYNGDGVNYQGSTSLGRSANVQAAQPSTTKVVTSQSPTVLGQQVTFTATVTKGGSGTSIPAGNVEFYDGVVAPGSTDLGAGTSLGNGVWSLSTTALTAGTHNIIAVYQQSAFYVSSQGTVSQQVNATTGTTMTKTTLTTSNSSSFYGSPVTFTAAVALSNGNAASPVPTGNVVFKDTFNGTTTTLGNGTYNPNGSWTLTTSSLAVTTAMTGAHNITAYYQGDVNYAASTSGTQIQNVSQVGAGTSYTGSITPSNAANPTLAVNQTVDLSVHVSSMPNGGGTPLGSGTVTFYQSLNGATPTVLGYGTFNGSDWVLKNAVFSAPGTYTITATFGGNGSYGASNDTTSPQLTETVSGPGSSTTNTTVSGSNTGTNGMPALGQVVTFTANVKDPNGAFVNSSGTVAFYDTYHNTTSLLGYGMSSGNGVYTLNASFSQTGTHSVSASYSGTTVYAASGSNTPAVENVTVAGTVATTTTAGTSNANPVPNQPVTLSATVKAGTTPVPNTGSVQFFDNGTNSLGYGTFTANGVWTLSGVTFATGSGTHSITASYSGDSTYKASTSTNTVTETVASPGTGASALSAVTPSNTTPIAGQPVNLSVTGTGGAATGGGTVTFLDNGAAIGTGTYNSSTGKWTLSNVSFTAGNHTLTASFSGIPAGNGSAGYQAATSAAPDTKVNVQPAGNMTTTTTGNVTTPSSNPATSGQPVTFSVSVTSSSGSVGTTGNGSVTFYDNGNVLGTGSYNPSTGAWTLTTGNLTPGSHSVTATYSGTTTNSSSSSQTPLALSVKAATTTSVSSSSASPNVGQSVTFTAKVTSSFAGTPTGTVQFLDGTKILGYGTLTNGQATFSTSSLTAGGHSIQAVYQDDNTYAGSTSAFLSQTVLTPPPPSGGTGGTGGGTGGTTTPPKGRG